MLSTAEVHELSRRLTTAANLGYQVANQAFYRAELLEALSQTEHTVEDDSEVSLLDLCTLYLSATWVDYAEGGVEDTATVTVVTEDPPVVPVDETVEVSTEASVVAETTEVVEEAPKAYEDMTKEELLDVAKELDIAGRSGLNKADLLAAVLEVVEAKDEV